MKTIRIRSLLLILFFALFTAPHSFAENTNSQQNSSNVPVTRPATASQPPASIFDSADPFEEMEKAQKGMNKIFKESMRHVRNIQQSGKYYEPDTDFLEKDGQYVLKVDLPGMTKDKINIEIVDNSIVISGERKTERQVENKKEGVFQFERSSGSFYRRLTLPADAITDNIQAKYENGVLEVSMPKLKSVAPLSKKVAIQ